MKKRLISIFLVIIMVVTLVPVSVFADSAISLARPTISSIAGSSSGITIKWSSVSGAASYNIKRKTADGSYEDLVTVSKTSYTDTDVSHGEKYTYKVCAVRGSIKGLYSSAKSLTYTSFIAPVLNSATYSGTSVTLKWSKVAGADGYKIYQKRGSGSYTLVKTVSNNLLNSTTLKDRDIGIAYTYKIKAYADDGTASVYSNTKTLTLKLSAPKITKTASATASSITIGWSKVDGADGYYVYKKLSDGTWKKIATVKGESTVSYKASSLSAGKYSYAVKAYCVTSSKTYISSYSAAIAVRTLGSISNIIVAPVSGQDALKVTWSKVTGATGYELYYKRGDNGVWLKAKTTSSTSYTMDVKHGVHYYFKVRAIYESSSAVTNGAYKQYSGFKMIYHTPDFDVTLAALDGQSAEILAVYIKNNGDEKMRIYSSDAKVVDGSDSKKLSIVKVSIDNMSAKKASYTDVAAGEENLVSFVADDSTALTFNNASSKLVFTFSYDSVIYTATVTKDGSSFAFKEYE